VPPLIAPKDKPDAGTPVLESAHVAPSLDEALSEFDVASLANANPKAEKQSSPLLNSDVALHCEKAEKEAIDKIESKSFFM